MCVCSGCFLLLWHWGFDSYAALVLIGCCFGVANGTSAGVFNASAFFPQETLLLLVAFYVALSVDSAAIPTIPNCPS